MKKLRQRATLDEVKTAITSLNKQGIKPTADNIITEIVQSSNGTVGIAKGTVLKFRRVLESLDDSLLSGSVKSTKTVQFKKTKSVQSKPDGLDVSLLSTLESKLKVQLETYLDDKLREQFATYQVNQANEFPLDEAFQDLHELWLDSVTKYTSVQAQLENLEREIQRLSEFETQTTESKIPNEINEPLALENQELKAQLEAIQQLVQTKDEELEELSLENNELKLRLRPDHEAQQVLQTKDEEIARLQSTLDQTTNRIEAQQNQFNQLNQNLRELHELWLEAVFQIPTATPSASASVIIEIDPLENYFQAVTQLHRMTPVQKYDYAMRLFEQGFGPSEVSRILAVNKGTLQHYKEGKRKRPEEE